MSSNNNKIYTPEQAYEILKQAFVMIMSKKSMDLDIKKSLYNGFYAGFIFLIKLPNLDPTILGDLIAKKSILDKEYSKNITYNGYNMLKVHKSIANKIKTQASLANTHTSPQSTFAPQSA